VEPDDVDSAEDPGLAAPFHHAAILRPQPRQLGDLLLRRARGGPAFALPRFPFRLRSPLGLAPSRLADPGFLGAPPLRLRGPPLLDLLPAALLSRQRQSLPLSLVFGAR